MNRSNRQPRKRSGRRRQPVGVTKSNPPLQVGQGQFVPKLSRVSLRFSATSDVKIVGLDLIRVSGNNVQDPLGSTGTGAPPGFNYWASMYERYRVIGSRCELTARICSETKDASTITTSGRIILFPSNNTTALASGSDYGSQPFAKTRSVTTAQPCRMVSTMKTATILGQKDVLGSDRLQSTVLTGPSDEWFWRAITAPDNDVSTNTMYCVTICVTYDVEFFDRQPLDRPSVNEFFQKAWLANCRLILDKQLALKEARDKSRQKFEEKLIESIEDSKDNTEPVLISPPVPSVTGLRVNVSGSGKPVSQPPSNRSKAPGIGL